MDKEQRMHKDAEERRAYQQAYYKAHRDVLKARHNAWNHAHKEQMREYSKRYYREHKEELKAKHQAKTARKEDLT